MLRECEQTPSNLDECVGQCHTLVMLAGVYTYIMSRVQ